MTVSIEQAQLKLAELMEKSRQGEKVVITGPQEMSIVSCDEALDAYGAKRIW